MLIVDVESPFKPSNSDVARYEGRYSPAELMRQNLVYARMALLDSLRRGESGYSTVLMYGQVLPPDDALIVKSAIEMRHFAGLVALYVDLGVSAEMKKAAEHAQLLGVDQTRRALLNHGTKDARELLADRDLPSFPCLEELQAAEFRAKQGKVAR